MSRKEEIEEKVMELTREIDLSECELEQAQGKIDDANKEKDKLLEELNKLEELEKNDTKN